MRRSIFLLIACLAGPVFAKKPDPVPALCSEPVKPSLFISPMGEPFRPKGDDDDPVKRWFDQADQNKDGKLTVGEMMLDADRFFLLLDKDGNGELLPDEVAAYETDLPEIRLYQARPQSRDDAPRDRKAEREARDDMRKRATAARRGELLYDAAFGGGRYGLLGIPNPVASADRDFNRAVERQEFRSAAASRFNDLDPKQSKALALADLPRTPAQQLANLACIARVAEKKEKRK